RSTRADPGRKDLCSVAGIVFSDLRPHQLRALEAIERAIAAEETRMRVVLATGSGKSAGIAHAFGKVLKSRHARRPPYLTSTLAMAHQMLAVLSSMDLGDDGPLGDTHYVQLLQSGTKPDTRPGVVTIATSSKFRSLVQTGTAPVFDLIALDDLDSGVDWSS